MRLKSRVRHLERKRDEARADVKVILTEADRERLWASIVNHYGDPPRLPTDAAERRQS